ncbi:MAG: hypothetical protein QW774_03480 [Candidatus Micrarchaeaceae archaeon]
MRYEWIMSAYKSDFLNALSKEPVFKEANPQMEGLLGEVDAIISKAEKCNDPATAIKLYNRAYSFIDSSNHKPSTQHKLLLDRLRVLIVSANLLL